LTKDKLYPIIAQFQLNILRNLLSCLQVSN
jgi:hypothetical protein